MKELIKDIKKHFYYYLVLLVILNLGIGLFYLFRFNPLYQMKVILATSIAYVVWGIIHHWLSEDLHLKVVLEYLLIAILVNLIVLSLLFRA